MQTKNRNRQTTSGITTKQGHISPDIISNLFKLKHHVTRPIKLNRVNSTTTLGVRIEETLVLELEAERIRAMGRVYSNMIPPR